MANNRNGTGHAIARRTTLAAVIAIMPMSSAAGQSETVAVSREYSLYNDIANSENPVDAASREMSVSNDLLPPDNAQDSGSRELSVFNDLLPPDVVPTDAFTRELSIYNEPIAPDMSVDANSRELSIEDVIHCTGDFNNDFALTAADIPWFIDALLYDFHPARQDAADMNCDGFADGQDLQAFVDCVIGGACP